LKKITKKKEKRIKKIMRRKKEDCTGYNVEYDDEY